MKVRDLNSLLAFGKGFTTEFKNSGSSDLGPQICAFANATGKMIVSKLMNGEVPV
jgi:ATP-dependent DNA helicase RecG